MLFTGSGLTERRRAAALVRHYGELIAYGDGWTDPERQRLVGDLGRHEPQHPDAIMRSMQRRVDPTDSRPLWEQVAAEIRRAIAEGDTKPGEGMPLAKDLASVLGVDRDPVLRALHQVRDQGPLEIRQGRGITVAGTPERGAVLARLKEVVAFARRNGYRQDEIIAMIEAAS